MREVFLRALIVVVLVAGGLAGCASNAPAPVETRAPTRSMEGAAAVARPGHHIVKRGETLYSIARQYGRDYRELAAWNGLDDPGVIKLGQELRVVPPGSNVAGAPALAEAPAGETQAVAVPGPVAIVSAAASSSAGALSSAASSAAASGAATAVVPAAPVGQKAEPKGGRVAYSAQAWKDLQAGDKTPVAASAPAAQSQPEPAKPAASGAADEVEWAWPTTGKVLTTFNDTSSKGIDLAGSLGDPVLAAGAGKVMYAGSALRGYGNLVIIRHGSSFQSVYAHNSEILVKEGQTVQKGQKLAKLGSSDADRPKLHFEIRRQGKPVDPMKYLPTR